MGTVDQFKIENIFTNPKAVDAFVDTYNKNNPGHTMSDKDKQTLEADPKLAEAVFNGNIVKLIAARATTVEELKGKPPELLAFLGHKETQDLVTDNVVSVAELAKLSPEKLKGANEALMTGKDEEAAKILGLNKDQTEAFFKSVEKSNDPSQWHVPSPLLPPPTTPAVPKIKLPPTISV